VSDGWIGVDLDGCLAEYHGWTGDVGPPVPAMLARVKQWLAQGIEVRIVTARVAVCPARSDESGCVASPGFAEQQRAIIDAWCEEHLGRPLPVTPQKDFQMVTLYDDRCVPVEKNTGRLLLEGAE